MIAVSVLDVVELHRDGERIAVRPGKTTEVLVRLALEAGVMVRTETLLEDLWADEAAGTARNVLQTKVSRLRRALGDAALVTGTSAGYTLHVDPRAVDALEVLRLGEEASARRRGGDPSAALESCTRALAMFQGEILSAAGDGDWVMPFRARLGEVRLALVEDQIAARLDLGASGEVIGELEGLVNMHPLREGLWALLMVALYRDGRQADALATYQRVRHWLADELGLDPGRQLQQLEHQVLVHDPSLGVPSSTVRGLGPDRPAGNLPSISAELVGRETEVAAVADLLAAGRLVEIVGAGGVGKTAVAIATGRRLGSSDDAVPDGVWLARLETAATADDVIDTLVAALNVGSDEAMFERLKRSTALVILDNCEQIVDDVAALAVQLLDAAPGVRILCTSQVPLDIDGEIVFELAPLDLAAAVALSTVAPARAGFRAVRTRRCATCADRSMGSLWRSSSPPHGPRRCRSKRSPAASTIGSTCCATRPAVDRNVAEHSDRRSDGATTCCSPTISGACGPSPPSPAAHPYPLSSPFSPRSTSPQPPRSTWSAGWPSVHWSSSTTRVRRTPSATGCSTASAPSRSKR